ncbi:MAG: glycosyltransferase [bacterium]|nr:glycosyltransferase [bacterium]
MTFEKQNKKKILLAVTKSNWGGAQRYVYDLATNMPKSEFEIAVALGGDGLLKNKLEKENIRTITIPRLARDINIFDEFAVFFSLLKIFWQEKPDIVHLNSSKMAGLGALAARIAGIKKIIFTAHGWFFDEDCSYFVKAITLFLSWLTVMLSHKTIVISNAQYRETPSTFFWGNKISMIHNGTGIFEIKNKEESRQLILGGQAHKHEDDFWLGAIAEIHPSNNLVATIEAVSNYNKNNTKKIFYTVIGDKGDGKEYNKLTKLIKGRNLEENIFLAGFKNNASSLLPAFDVFLFTPKKVGLPYVLLEAGLAGLPIIATPVGGIPDVIENEKTGILTKSVSLTDIASILEKSMVDKNLQIYGKNLKNIVLRDFSLNKMLGQVSNLYLS